MIRPRVVVLTSTFGVPASVAGSRLSGAIPGNGHALMILTALLVAYTAYRTAFPTARTLERSGSPINDELWRLATIGVAAGALSGCSASAEASSWCRPSRPGSACR